MVRKKTKKRARKVVKNFWFKRRDNSEDAWGFIPVVWNGWVALILLIGVNIFAANYFDIMNVGFGEASRFLVVFFLSIAIFVLIAQRKTKS